MLVFNILALGQNIEDRQRRQIGNFTKLFQYFRNVVLPSQLWFDKIL